MRAVKKKIQVGLLASVMAFGASLPAVSHAQKVDERPGAASMVADAVLARPVMAVATAAGAVIYLASLPVSMLGGNAQESGQKLVVYPFRATFLRCLGCTSKHTDEYDPQR